MNKSRVVAIVLLVFVAGSVSFTAHAQTPLESLRDRAVNLGRQIMGNDTPVFSVSREKATSTSEEEIGVLRERLRNRVANPGELQATREERRVEFEGAVTEREAQLKERVARIAEQKRQIAEHVFSQLAEIKKRMLGQFLEVIDRLDAVLVSVLSRTDKAAEAGILDETAQTEVYGAIRSAEAAIVAARDAAHAEFDVVREVGDVADEETLRSAMTTLRNEVRGDLEAVRTKLREAHEAVRNAATMLAQRPRVDEVEE